MGGQDCSALDVAAVTQHMALHRTFPCWCPAWDPPSLARHPCSRLTGFGAGQGCSSGIQPGVHSSRPSAHMWCRWRCHGSRGWASRLEAERLRGQWCRGLPLVTVPPSPFPGTHNPSEPAGHGDLWVQASLVLKPTHLSPGDSLSQSLAPPSVQRAWAGSAVPWPMGCRSQTES